MIGRNFLFICIALMCLSSCKNQQIAKELRQFQKETVEIPVDLQKIDRRVQSEIGAREKKPALILYHDSLSCSMCQISHLSDLSDIYALADSLGNFKVMCIFSPREEEYDEVMKNLIYRNFEYPVYVDFSGSFRQKNKCIPDDASFHNFLIDRDGHPVCVGNPAASDTMWKLFNEALTTLDRHTVDNGSYNN